MQDKNIQEQLNHEYVGKAGKDYQMKIMLQSKAVMKVIRSSTLSKDVLPYRNLPMFLRNPHDYIALPCVLMIFYYGILLDILLSVRHLTMTLSGSRGMLRYRYSFFQGSI
jgi:hypothetical protein